MEFNCDVNIKIKPDERLLEIVKNVKITEGGTVVIPEKIKKLIHEVANEWREHLWYQIYQAGKDKFSTYKEDWDVGKMWIYMYERIKNAPTDVYAYMTLIMLLPTIDDKLQAEKLA